MQKVTGVGGVFVRTPDAAKLARWYQEHLGFDIEDWGGSVFQWNSPGEAATGSTTWGLFPSDSEYFGTVTQQSMINYRVKDLAAMLTQLRDAGVEVLDHVEEHEFGKFGWAVDCDGNRLELWEPPGGM